jgi:hypothetical protein
MMNRFLLYYFVQQGRAADGLNTLVMTQKYLPPLTPKPLDRKNVKKGGDEVAYGKFVYSYHLLIKTLRIYRKESDARR